MTHETATLPRINTVDNLVTNFGTHIRTRIGQWNVRTMMESSRLAQIESEMKRYRVKILGVSETRWPGLNEITTAKGNKFIYSGNNNGGSNGVGMIIDKSISSSMMSWKAVSDRIILVRFYSRIRKITIIQCYAPTETANDELKDEFYSQLTSVISNIPRTDIIILMGDLNAKIGTRMQGDPQEIIGSHGIGSRNNNGSRLLDLCTEFNLAVGGTLFPHKNIHKYTWESPNGHTRNQIDHICINTTWKRSLLDVRSRRGADIHSDHMLVTADVRLKPSTIRYAAQRRRELSTRQLGPSDIQSCIRQIGEETLGTVRTERKAWISDDTWAKIERRRNLKTTLLTRPTPELRAEYNNVAKQVKRSAKNDKRRYYNTLASQAQAAAERNDMRTLYNKIRTITKCNTKNNRPINDKNGCMLTSRTEQLHRWREHFQESGATALQHTETDQNTSYTQNSRISISPPTQNEISDALKRLKQGRAEGPDGIPAELLQADTRSAVAILHPILQSVWEDEIIPTSWKQGIIVKLPKRGDLRECSNWRGITVQNSVNKVLALVILARIEDKLEETLREEQAGFRRQRGCIDQSNTLRLIVEQSVEWRSPLFIHNIRRFREGI
ncbi:uncharacterized protein LOC129613579 [Condylostylus longicornis]|uniref:uncharacterized protein LOC129613579 n=1 Tax=Condylostylus longicornis TaxID=2530218 RepID=UPI00244DDA7B|nr:uncharacterized protein LOC129613579 [Condylostylus longicornis]